MQSYNEILKKVTCNWMREITPQRAEQAAKEYAEQAIDRCAEKAENHLFGNKHIGNSVKRVKQELT